MVNSSIVCYAKRLIGSIYKILPLWEKHGDEEQSPYQKYIDSLWREINGATYTFPALSMTPEFISVINTIAYIRTHHITHEDCRREVFRMIELLNMVIKKAGEVDV